MRGARWSLIGVLPLLLALVGGTASANAPPVTVGVDFSHLPDATFRSLAGAALEKHIIVRLVQEGFAVVSVRAPPQIVVTLRHRDRLLSMEGRAAGSRLGRTVSLAATRPALHLEISQKIVELARALRVVAQRAVPPAKAPAAPVGKGPAAPVGKGPPAPLGKAPAAPVGKGPAAPVGKGPAAPVGKGPAPPVGKGPTAPVGKGPAAPVATAPGPRGSSPPEKSPSQGQSAKVSLGGRAPDWATRVESGVTVAALVRSSGTDPLLLASARVGFGPALGLHFQLGFASASSVAVQVREVQVQVGVGYRFPLVPKLDLELALCAGGLVHLFDVDDATVLQSRGSRLDLLVSGQFLMRWRPWRGLLIALRLSPGMADAERAHLIGGQTVWDRGRFRLEAGAAIGWQFR